MTATRKHTAALVLLLLLCVSVAIFGGINAQAASDDGHTPRRFDIDLPRQSVAESLNQLARQTGEQFLFSYKLARQKEAPPVRGRYTLLEAVERILKGSGLKGGYVEGVLTILDAEALIRQQSMSGTHNDRHRELREMNLQKKTVLTAAIAYLLSGGSVQQGMAAPESQMAQKTDMETSKRSRGIEEVLVTATKRETRLQDTAMSINVIGAEEIDKRGLVGAEDFLRSVPGVNYIEFGPGTSKVAVRGLSTHLFFEDSTTSSYLGEVPTSVTSTFSNRSDLKLVDLERVEVLRGPQGTLYGAGAMGGTVRNIPKAPNLSETEGFIDVGLSGNSESDDLSNKQVGVFNLPLITDELAVRAVAYRFDNAGYSDFVETPYIKSLAEATGTTVEIEEDYNSSEYQGGRIHLNWQPNDDLDLSLVFGNQVVKSDEGAGGFVPSAGSYKSYGLSEEGRGRESSHQFSHLLINYNLGWATLTSATTKMEYDLSNVYGGAQLGPYAVSQYFSNKAEGAIEELRLSSSLEGDLQFTLGLYYEDVTGDADGGFTWVGTQSSLEALGFLGTDPEKINRGISQTNIKQKAIFGEIDYSLTEHWKINLGGRWFDYDSEKSDRLAGSFGANGVPLTPSYVSAKEHDTNLKFGLSYQADADKLFYASWSQGFRLGRGQTPPNAALCDTNGDGRIDGNGLEIRTSVDSDSIDNMEVGAKLTLADGRAIVNTALYRIDWQDIPISIPLIVSGGACSLIVNAGEARSQGIEVDTQFYLTQNVKLNLGLSYNDSEFLEAFALANFGGNASKGQRLPGFPEVNGNLGLEYGFEIGGHNSFARADYTYASGAYSSVTRNTPKTDGYGQLNVTAGVDFSDISLEFYIHNLTGEDVILAYETPTIVYQLKPRSYGVNLRYQF